MTRVSVVIPTYNRADLIGKTLDSVLAQTYGDLEIIVVDDGSTDDTRAILSQYRDKRLSDICQENQGPGLARNTGIRAAKGEWVAFVDSDDLWVPEKLERQLALLDSLPELMWVYSDACFFDSETGQTLYVHSRRGRQYEGHVAHQLIMGCFIPSPTPVIRRSVFDDVGMFWDAPKAEDWDMWLRIAAKYPVRKVHEVLAGYRNHKGSATKSQSPLFKHQYQIEVVERAVASAPDIYEPVRQRALSAQHLYTGQLLTAQEDLVGARRMFTQAIRHWPGMWRAYPFWAITFLGQEIVNRLVQMKRLGGW